MQAVGLEQQGGLASWQGSKHLFFLFGPFILIAENPQIPFQVQFEFNQREH